MTQNKSRRVPSMPGSFGVNTPVQRATTPAELEAMSRAAHARSRLGGRAGNPLARAPQRRAHGTVTAQQQANVIHQANPAVRPAPTMPGTFANSQMSVATPAAHRGTNIAATKIAQHEAEAAWERHVRDSNPRIPTMPGVFANSQMPVGDRSLHRGHNIAVTQAAQLAAAKVTHSIPRASNPCQQPATKVTHAVPRTSNPWYHSGRMPGSYGMPMLGMGDNRGKQAPSYTQSIRALQGNPQNAVTAQQQQAGTEAFAPAQRFRRSLARAARQHYAANPDSEDMWDKSSNFGPLARFQRSLRRANPHHKALHTAKARMRKQGNPQQQANIVHQATTTQGVRGGHRGQVVTGGASHHGHGGGRWLRPKCPSTHWYDGLLCQPKPKKQNPPPEHRSKSTSDTAFGVYHPNGHEEFLTDVNAAKSRGQELSRRHGGSPIMVRSYTGDGKGGWKHGQVYGVTAPVSNPSGCSACATKAAGTPR